MLGTSLYYEFIVKTLHKNNRTQKIISKPASFKNVQKCTETITCRNYFNERMHDDDIFPNCIAGSGKLK